MKSDFNSGGAAGTAAGLRLCDLDPGGEAVVVDVDCQGPVGRRLLDLGLLPETHVKLLRRAPLGDPILFELRGYRLCLRGVDAARVRVRAAEPSGGVNPA